MKRIHTVYTKKELHDFVNSIDIDSTSNGIKHLEYQKKWPNNKSFCLKEKIHKSIARGMINNKTAILFQLCSRNDRMEEFHALCELHNLDPKEEHNKKNKYSRKRTNNAKYVNQLSIRRNKRLNNLSKNKIEQLETDVINYIKSKANHNGSINYLSREDIAMHYKVKLKYIDQIFQKLLREGRLIKMEGRTNDAYQDSAWHATFYYTNLELI